MKNLRQLANDIKERHHRLNAGVKRPTVQTIFEGDEILPTTTLTICMGPRMTGEEQERDTEVEIIRGNVEVSNHDRDGKPWDMTRAAVLARWEARGDPLPGQHGYKLTRLDTYAERTWPGYLLESGLIQFEDRELYGAYLPTREQWHSNLPYPISETEGEHVETNVPRSQR
jgi:hypothetical protein